MSLLSRTYSQHYPHRIPSCALKLLVTSRIPVGDTSRWQLKVFWNITGLQRVSNERLKLTVVFWIGIPNTNTSTKYQNENLTTTRYFKGQRLRHFLLFHPYYFFCRQQTAVVSWEQLEQQACRVGISCFSMFPVILSQLLGYMSTLFLEFTAPPELQWFWAASTCVPSKAPAFPLKSDFAFRSDSCNSRHWCFREWFGYFPSEILVELLTRKVKHFHSFSKLTYRTKDQAENIRKRMGKKSLPGK